MQDHAAVVDDDASAVVAPDAPAVLLLDRPDAGPDAAPAPAPPAAPAPLALSDAARDRAHGPPSTRRGRRGRGTRTAAAPDANAFVVQEPPRDHRRRSRPAASRRALARSAAAATAAVLLGAAVAPHATAPTAPSDDPVPARLPAYAHIDLYQEGVTVGAGGRRAAVAPGSAAPFFAGTHVLDPAAVTLVDALGGLPRTASSPGSSRADAAQRAAGQRAWLAAGTVPGAGGPYEDMARAALLDLHTLVLPGGAAVAGWSPRWRYVWPRDSAFVAVALARTGHVDDALDVLGFLDRVQAGDGSFEARYEPDGSGPPDDRGLQTDGTGWALWAAGTVLAEVPDADERRTAAAQLRPLVVRSTQHALDLVARTGLPPASADYWETPEQELTLGTAAPIVAGLEQAATVLPLTGDTALARSAAAAAARSRVELVRAFAPTGYARYAAGGHRDAATAFLLPPFLRVPPPGARTAWRESAPTMVRPANGLAPGADWRDDGISWTPQTSLYAWLAAESGDAPLAHGWLDFLDAHRTSTGSIPEKVLADGSPAAVAPLAWSAACALLALDALDRRDDDLRASDLPPLG
ncbi:glycoside hydrolase family 15 [Cellulomonas sp.]|uniref:glycoside hydrolase family 15 n=1 Tax=Cellulomonas sp. TaxID=40001 RepID=UPI001B06FB7C|nr:glycoside hydrolase family 15 [Cellulomonas sp.]MBO9553039.1 glycoside hydrolase family 15 [Cellulomonas sp.]